MCVLIDKTAVASGDFIPRPIGAFALHLTGVSTAAEKCGYRRIRRLSPFSRRFRRQSHFSATVAVFGDSVDRAIGRKVGPSTIP